MSIGGPGGTNAGIDRAACTELWIFRSAPRLTVAVDELPVELELQLAIAPPKATVAPVPIARRPPFRISARRVSDRPHAGRPPPVETRVLSIGTVLCRRGSLGLAQARMAAWDTFDELE